MKQNYWFTLVLAAISIVFSACGSNQSNQTASAPTPVPTPTVIQATPTPAPTPLPTPIPTGPAFSVYRKNLEIMEEANVARYANNVRGTKIGGWVGRIHDITEYEPGYKIVEIEMDYERTNQETAIPDAVLNGLSESLLEQLKPGQIINFSGTIETITEVNRRKKAIVITQVAIFGLSGDSPS